MAVGTVAETAVLSGYESVASTAMKMAALMVAGLAGRRAALTVEMMADLLGYATAERKAAASDDGKVAWSVLRWAALMAALMA